MTSADPAAALASLRQRIDAAVAAAGRIPGSVTTLLAVKTLTVDTIRAAIAAGGTVIGHNRAQELTAVEPGLDLLHTSHFIGHLQSNKVTAVLRWVDCVQTVDSLRLATRLAASRRRFMADGVVTGGLDVFIQVNTSGETTKAGVEPRQALDLAGQVADLDGLRLCGLMTIGANSPDTGVVRASYDRLAQISADLTAAHPQAGELSMGMSGDLEIAIAAGATMVRVGTAVFGARNT